MLLLGSFAPTLAQTPFYRLLPGFRGLSLELTDSGAWVAGIGADGGNANQLRWAHVNYDSTATNLSIFQEQAGQGTSYSYTAGMQAAGQSPYIVGTFNGSGTPEARLYRFDANRNTPTLTVPFPLGSASIMNGLQVDGDSLMLFGTWQDGSNKIRSRLLRTDSLGNAQWEEDYECAGNCAMAPTQIHSTADGGYLLTLSTEEPGFDIWDAAILKVNAQGQEQWRWYPGNDSTSNLHLVVSATSNNEFIAAWSDPFWRPGIFAPSYQVNDSCQIHVARFDQDGNVLASFSMDDELTAWVSDSIRAFYLTDVKPFHQQLIWSGYYVTDQVDGLLISTNLQGQLQWLRRYRLYPNNLLPGGFMSTRLYGLQTSENGFWLSGEFLTTPGNLFPFGAQQSAVIYTDTFGCIDPGCELVTVQEHVTTDRLRLFPNPAHEYVTIQFPDEAEVREVQLFSLDGKLRQSFVIRQETETLSLEGLPAGMYLLKADGRKSQMHGRLIVR